MNFLSDAFAAAGVVGPRADPRACMARQGVRRVQPRTASFRAWNLCSARFSPRLRLRSGPRATLAFGAWLGRFGAFVSRQHLFCRDRADRASCRAGAAADARLAGVPLEGIGRRGVGRRGCSATIWYGSPYLRGQADATSVAGVGGLSHQGCSRTRPGCTRISAKIVIFVATAPIIGHGTGSIPEQFRNCGGRPDGASAVHGNPHNQIFAVAIQLGPCRDRGC